MPMDSPDVLRYTTHMPIESWPRPRFEPGGGDAMVLYAVFGAFGELEPLRAERYRTEGPPEGVEVFAYGPMMHPEVLDSFRSEWAWQRLEESAPDLWAEVARAEQCMVLRGVVHDPGSLDYLRDVIGTITYLLDGGGIAVYDAQVLRWWSTDDWHRRVFEQASFGASPHVSILFTDDDAGRGRWYHTRGMRKFGRPDLSVTNVPEGADDSVVDLIGLFIEHQALGGHIAEEGEVRVAGLPEGLVCRHAGDLDDVDFNDTHVEIAWPEDAR